ncbi:MAG: ribosome biogenesis GTPase Der [Pseudomonadota bacterium]
MLTVALVGRPNVGKSTLFNRLVGKRIALVDDRPGVTRDRREGEAQFADLHFRVIDTAGLEDAPEESLPGRMRMQTEAAIDEADAVVFLMDARAGVMPDDEHFAQLLLKSGKPVILAANKAEGRAGQAGAYEAFRLGLGDPIILSAEHGDGMADLYQAIAAEEPEDDEAEPEEDEDTPLRLAVIGRPNAGKSTLINRMVGSERLLTGPEAGITRDSIELDWEWQGRPVRLVDTAGMRRKAKVQDKLERLSVADSLRSIQFAHVVVLLMDVHTAFEKQDLQIADLVLREGRGLVIALNKWDEVHEHQAVLADMRERLGRLLPQARGVPMVTCSALAGTHLDKVMTAAFRVYETWNTRIKTAPLNDWLIEAVSSHPPPSVSGRRVKLRYMTQVKARPPTFVAFCSRPDAVPEAYRRYLVNGLRETFKLPGVPIRLQLRKRDNPYAPS